MRRSISTKPLLLVKSSPDVSTALVQGKATPRHARNVGALARDSAPKFNSPGPEGPSAGQLNAGYESRETLRRKPSSPQVSPGGTENAA